MQKHFVLSTVIYVDPSDRYIRLYFPGHIHNLIAKNKRTVNFSAFPSSASPPSVRSPYDIVYISNLSSFFFPLKNILLGVQSSRPRDRFIVKLMFHSLSLALTPLRHWKESQEFVHMVMCFCKSKIFQPQAFKSIAYFYLALWQTFPLF